MPAATPRYAPHPDAAWRNVEGHVFIITPDSRQHELDGDVELLVWTLCDSSPQTKKELLDAVVTEFDVDVETASKDLETFIDQLVAGGVVIAVS